MNKQIELLIVTLNDTRLMYGSALRSRNVIEAYNLSQCMSELSLTIYRLLPDANKDGEAWKDE